jgi:protein-tyrosine phosphatase
LIDLHSHILPGIDDGAADLGVSLQMARAAVSGGVQVMACTPHIMQGLWNNTGPDIRRATEALQSALDTEGVPLKLVTGADLHVVYDMLAGLRSGRFLSLADSRYVLLELPHHVAPARLDDCFYGLLAAGFVPILTHPERLTWLEAHYASIRRLAASGVWMQITAGSLLGSFGRRARYWGERMIAEGVAHVLASDAHDAERRPPDLREGREAAAQLIGVEEAHHLVVTRPCGIIQDQPPSRLPPPLSESRTRDEYLENRPGHPVDGEEEHAAAAGNRSLDIVGRMRKLVGRIR